jgi:hypothetical protein
MNCPKCGTSLYAERVEKDRQAMQSFGTPEKQLKSILISEKYCPACHPEIKMDFLDGRDQSFLRRLMDQREQSAGAVVRHLFRLGQTVDHYMNQGYSLIFRKGDEEIDPLRPFPKMAPMPNPPEDDSHLTDWEGEGGAVHESGD